MLSRQLHQRANRGANRRRVRRPGTNNRGQFGSVVGARWFRFRLVVARLAKCTGICTACFRVGRFFRGSGTVLSPVAYALAGCNRSKPAAVANYVRTGLLEELTRQFIGHCVVVLVLDDLDFRN